MRYKVDHDFHIHSTLSFCCHDPRQVPEAILKYGEQNGFKKLCLTNHFWDETVPAISENCKRQGFPHVSSALPLPQGKSTEFKFGCETDLDKFLTLGISKERFNQFDFVIVPTTHMHLEGFTVENGFISDETRAMLWSARLSALFNMDLPWHKVGIAHLTCSHISPDSDPLQVLSLVPDDTMHRIFRRAQALGVGIELNFDALGITDKTADRALRTYRIAKDEGCKFYLGSDSHKIESMQIAKENFERMVTLLDLTEADKFDF